MFLFSQFVNKNYVELQDSGYVTVPSSGRALRRGISPLTRRFPNDDLSCRQAEAAAVK